MFSHVIHCDSCRKEIRCPYNNDPADYAVRAGWWVNGLCCKCHECVERDMLKTAGRGLAR